MLEAANTDATELRLKLGIPKETTKLVAPVAMPRGKGRPSDADRKRQSVFTKKQAVKNTKPKCTADGDITMKSLNKCSVCNGTEHNSSTCSKKGWAQSTLARFVSSMDWDKIDSEALTQGQLKLFAEHMKKMTAAKMVQELQRRGAKHGGKKEELAKRLAQLGAPGEGMELCEPASGEGMELCEPVPSAVHGLSAEQAAATIEAALASEHTDGVGDGVGDGVAPIELQVDIRQLLGNQADRAAQATDPELELDIIGAVYGPQGHKKRIMIESLRRLVKWDFDDDPDFSSCEGLYLNSTLVHGYLWHVQQLHLEYGFN